MRYLYYKLMAWLMGSSGHMFNASDQHVREVGESLLLDGMSLTEVNDAMVETWRDKQRYANGFLSSYTPLTKIPKYKEY